MANTHKVWWLDAGARLGGTDCITFFATAPVAAPCAPQRLNSVVRTQPVKGSLTRLGATLDRLGEPLRWSAGRSGV